MRSQSLIIENLDTYFEPLVKCRDDAMNFSEARSIPFHFSTRDPHWQVKKHIPIPFTPSLSEGKRGFFETLCDEYAWFMYSPKGELMGTSSEVWYYMEEQRRIQSPSFTPFELPIDMC
jgi:hypothetical protein